MRQTPLAYHFTRSGKTGSREEKKGGQERVSGTGKSFQNRNDMVIFITEERSPWAKKASAGQEKPETSGKRLLQCPGKKRQQQSPLGRGERLDWRLCFIYPFSTYICSGHLFTHYIISGQALCQLLGYSSEQSNTKSLPSQS